MFSFSSLTPYLILMFLPLNLANTTSNTPLSCYVCGEVVNDCSKYNYTDMSNAKVCLSDSKACSVYYDGESIISMGCESYKFNLCRQANSITYCYCDSHLCNGNNLLQNAAIGKTSVYTSDDEDLQEGSGFSTESHNTKQAVPTLPSTMKPPNTGLCVRSNTGIFISSAIVYSVYYRY